VRYVAALAVGQERGVRGHIGDYGVDWRAGVWEDALGAQGLGRRGCVCEGVWKEGSPLGLIEAFGNLEERAGGATGRHCRREGWN
jgi:hypothetical protein